MAIAVIAASCRLGAGRRLTGKPPATRAWHSPWPVRPVTGGRGRDACQAGDLCLRQNRSGEAAGHPRQPQRGARRSDAPLPRNRAHGS